MQYRLLIMYMLSKPDDWIFQPSVIAREMDYERSRTVSKYLNDMSDLGMIERDKKTKWKISEKWICTL